MSEVPDFLEARFGKFERVRTLVAQEQMSAVAAAAIMNLLDHVELLERSMNELTGAQEEKLRAERVVLQIEQVEHNQQERRRKSAGAAFTPKDIVRATSKLRSVMPLDPGQFMGEWHGSLVNRELFMRRGR